jgi:small subunit ribosomal protein S20
MPNIKSAKKKLRQDVKKAAQNDAYFNKTKKILKTITKNKDAKKSPAMIQEAYSLIDKAAKKNVIHKNKAARLKSRVSRLASATQ